MPIRTRAAPLDAGEVVRHRILQGGGIILVGLGDMALAEHLDCRRGLTGSRIAARAEWIPPFREVT
jgi:hypothetical protein